MSNDALTRISGKETIITPQVALAPERLSSIHHRWLEEKRAQLSRAQVALEAVVRLFQQGGLTEERVKRVRERVQFLGRVVSAMEHGYVPIPRLGGQRLQIEAEELPPEVLLAYAQAQGAKLFGEFRLVAGEEASSRGRRGRRAARDPLLIGVVRTPEHRIETGARGWPIIVPAREAHFLISWWRPEDEQPEEMY